jgi:NADH-ubiquinone oxidoreductase chain 5
MYLSILSLPLLGSIISGFLGRKLGVTGSQFISTFCLFLSSILATVAFYEVGLCHSPVSINLLSWIDSEILNVSWEFMFDSLTVSMLIPVLYVSTLVHVYSVSYMSSDPHNQRFFSYLSLFTFFMLILVSGANYLIMFIGWEGIGVSSYLLINFWYTRLAANKAALQAFTVNRVGDMILSIGFFAILFLFGNLDYATVFSISPYMNETALTIIALLLLGGAMAKSSQIGLHTWLPTSMEGPTPVSALIHAATLVTAGVYLLLRSSPLLEYAPTALIVITFIGSLTAFFAGTCALVQNDLKRIIAFSTISQMGYLFLAVGLSQYQVALFHLINHAFFKALLFLGAGAVIHAMSDQQDIRRLGGLINFLPFTYSAMLTGSLSLMALPWLTGFYSKDLILELAYGQYQFTAFFAWVLGTATAMLTAFYSFRLISLAFLTYPNAPRNNYLNVHEADIFVIIPLFVLSLFSIFFGYIASDIYVGLGSDFMGASLFQHPSHITLVEAEFSLPIFIKLLPAIVTLIGAGSAILFYHKYYLFILTLTNTKFGRTVYTFLNYKYLIDIIYNNYIIQGGLQMGYSISKILDRGIIELVGPFGLSSVVKNTGDNIAKLDTGIVTSYALYIVLGLITLVFLLFAPILLNSSLLTEIRLIVIYLPTLFLLNNKSI